MKHLKCLPTIEKSPEDIDMIVDNLQPSTAYRVKIYAKTRAGAGVENFADVKTTMALLHPGIINLVSSVQYQRKM